MVGCAGVVKLAYTPALGAGARKSVRVQVPPPAPLTGGAEPAVCPSRRRAPVAVTIRTHLTFGKAILTLRGLTESERGVLTEVDVAGERR